MLTGSLDLKERRYLAVYQAKYGKRAAYGNSKRKVLHTDPIMEIATSSEFPLR